MLGGIFVCMLGQRWRERRKQSEIDIHRLERSRTGIDRFDMSAGDMGEQRTVRGGRRRRNYVVPESLRGRMTPVGGTLPAIAVSGAASPEDRRRVADAGALCPCRPCL